MRRDVYHEVEHTPKQANVFPASFFSGSNPFANPSFAKYDSTFDKY